MKSYKNIAEKESFRCEKYSILEKLSFSSPAKCKKLCAKAVKLALSDVKSVTAATKKQKTK